MGYREPFTLYPRKAKNGKRIWYYRTYDQYGKRTSGKSTGQTSKAAARQYVIELIKKGGPVTKKDLIFAKYAENWWVWNRCPYIRGRVARGKTISRSHADAMRTYLTQHILPYFNNVKLSSISPNMVEEWVMGLREKNGRTGQLLAHSTINHSLKCLKLLLGEAKRRGYLYENPAEVIELLDENPTKKSILSIDEVRRLFREDKMKEIWNGDHKHYTLNLVAGSTGIHQSSGRAYRSPNSKQGNRYLKWCFSQAAIMAIRYYPEIRRLYERLAAKRRKAARLVARSIFAHKLAQAAFQVMKHQVAYKEELLFRFSKDYAEGKAVTPSE